MLTVILRYIFFTFFIRTIILLILGINVHRREMLPKNGPAILVANHNSHLDTMVLMSLFPFSRLLKLRPVAAGDYFLKTAFLRWLSLNIIRIIPISRNSNQPREDVFNDCEKALKENDILILFPEGTRGEPEVMVSFKKGIAHLIERNPDVPVHPVFLHGLGKALPKGEGLLVPFLCDVFIGEFLKWTEDRDSFMQNLDGRMKALRDESHFNSWN